MLQSLRSTAPQDAACSPLQPSIFRMPILSLSKSDIITATDARQSNSSRRFQACHHLSSGHISSLSVKDYLTLAFEIRQSFLFNNSNNVIS
jgi:hypothetical protein